MVLGQARLPVGPHRWAATVIESFKYLRMIRGASNSGVASVPHNLGGVGVGDAAAFATVGGHVASPQVVCLVDSGPRVSCVDMDVFDVVAVEKGRSRA